MHVVTGVFSYTGGYVARELLARGERVKTLSRRPDPSHPLSDQVAFGRLAFDEAALVEELRGASTLYNTYWIRFPRGAVTWDAVLANTRTLLRAARAAGVERLVHFSVANAAADSPFGYFRAKAVSEADVRAAGIAHAIVRPTLIVGRDDVLMNNVAWALRRVPLFVVPGGAAYQVQPIAATDVARLAVAAGLDASGQTVDAAGPDILTFEEIVRAVREAVGARTRIVRAPLSIALLLAGGAARALGDVVVTREELAALGRDLLVSREPPAGTTRFTDWLSDEGDELGKRFVSERRRNWEDSP